MDTTEPKIALQGISKAYGGVQALRDVSVNVFASTVHGFVGENGAGKSTLMRMISGEDMPDGGSLAVDGRAVRYRNPRDAARDGIVAVSQEVRLIPGRTVIENVFLGNEESQLGWYSKTRLRRRAEELEDSCGIALPWSTIAGSLSVAQQQKVELARALARQPRLLILDEPTAALGPVDTDELFRIIQMLCARGCTVLYVSHFLGEVLTICDRVTIMRDGQHVRTAAAERETERTLVAGMVGGAVGQLYPDQVAAPPSKAPTISIERLNSLKVSDVSLDVRPGEIVGLAGLVGSGRTSLIDAISGKYRPRTGTCQVDGNNVRLGSPTRMIHAGVAVLPESRKEDGLILERTILENTVLVKGVACGRFVTFRRRSERAAVRQLLSRLSVKMGDERDNVSTLSGGNQQKVSLAKWMWRQPQVLLADEPTRGVDVAARRAIYDLLVGLAAEGTAVLFASSDVDEVIGLAHRVLVMWQGRIVAELSGAELTSESIISAAFGLKNTREVDRVPD